VLTNIGQIQYCVGMMSCDKVNNSECPNCGEEFYCGVESGEDECWCMDIPKVSSDLLILGEACWCSNCLLEFY
jgi:hypothetical protein